MKKRVPPRRKKSTVVKNREVMLQRHVATAHFYRTRIAGTPGVEAVLQYLNATGRICLDHLAVGNGGYLAVLAEPEVQILRDQGLSVDILSELLTGEERDDIAVNVTRVDDGGIVDSLMTGFTTSYLDAAQVAARISSLAATFPAICHLSLLPEPTSGYDGSVPGLAGPANIQLLRITNTPATHSKPGLLFIGGTHAREWINPLIAIEFAEQLARNYNPASTDPAVIVIDRIVEQCDVFIIPVLNPDGLNFSRHDSAGWRKNRNPADSAVCPGIDNNRNFEIYFGGAGSSAAPCSDTYHGTSPFSEPENRNVRYVLEQNPNILVGVDSHSFGQKILRPNPSGGAFIASEPVSAADHAIYNALESTLQAAIQGVNGVTYSTGSTSNHAGTTDEYMFFAHRVFGFDLECALDFQPPFTDAQLAIQEVTAGMRALANATIDLTVTTPTPARIVQCIDRTGSMVAFGYEAPARANARRFIDMMSLGDSIAVVSFADPNPDPLATPPEDRATTEFPLTLLDDPGDFAAARASVDGIIFGGWTPIGAGLKRSADLLAGLPGPRGVLLLSDGFENRAPSVSGVMMTFPAGLRVFTIALGTAADVPLLQSIATNTGGEFYLSPTSLDLHEIYNQIRAGMTDEGLVLNDTTDSADPGSALHVAEVEHGAEKLLISVSWTKVQAGLRQRARKPRVEIFAPSGRKVRSSDWGVQITQSAEYEIVEILRPAPGNWLICTHGLQGPHNAAAFIKSPLKVHLRGLLGQGKEQLLISAMFEDRPLYLHSAIARWMPLPSAPASWIRKQHKAGPGWSDQLKPNAAGDLPQPKWMAPDYGPLEMLPGWTVNGAVGRLTANLPAGPHNVKLQINGLLPGGPPFKRVILRTIGSI
jgi:hypothetical protein